MAKNERTAMSAFSLNIKTSIKLTTLEQLDERGKLTIVAPRSFTTHIMGVSVCFRDMLQVNSAYAAIHLTQPAIEDRHFAPDNTENNVNENMKQKVRTLLNRLNDDSSSVRKTAQEELLKFDDPFFIEEVLIFAENRVEEGVIFYQQKDKVPSSLELLINETHDCVELLRSCNSEYLENALYDALILKDWNRVRILSEALYEQSD